MGIENRLETAQQDFDKRVSDKIEIAKTAVANAVSEDEHWNNQRQIDDLIARSLKGEITVEAFDQAMKPLLHPRGSITFGTVSELQEYLKKTEFDEASRHSVLSTQNGFMNRAYVAELSGHFQLCYFWDDQQKVQVHPRVIVEFPTSMPVEERARLYKQINGD
jgi:hypothetical protein